MGDVSSPHRPTTEPRDTLGRRYSPKTFPNSSARHPRATLKPSNVPQQFCAAPSGNALPLFRRWRVRIEAVLNKPGDSFSTLGRPLKPISFHNRAMRHSRATLLPQNVPQQFCAAPLGNALPLFRRWRVRIDPVSNKLGDTFSTLGRHYKPISFPNRAARHPRATLRHFFVAETYALIPSRISPETPSAMPTPLGDITSLYRSTTGPRDTLGQHFVTFSSPKHTH